MLYDKVRVLEKRGELERTWNDTGREWALPQFVLIAVYYLDNLLNVAKIGGTIELTNQLTSWS
jgi:hypothetical protein